MEKKCLVYALSLVVLLATFCITKAACQEQQRSEGIERAQELLRLLDNIFHVTEGDAAFTLATCDSSMRRVYYTIKPPSSSDDRESSAVSMTCNGDEDVSFKTFETPNMRDEYAGFFDVGESAGVCFLKFYSLGVEPDHGFIDTSRIMDNLRILAFEVVDCGEW